MVLTVQVDMERHQMLAVTLHLQVQQSLGDRKLVDLPLMKMVILHGFVQFQEEQ